MGLNRGKYLWSSGFVNTWIFLIKDRGILHCEWLNFSGVPIFLVFVEGLIHEFQCPPINDFLYELWRKVLWPQILNPTNVSFSFNPWKLVPTKIKPSKFMDIDFFFSIDICKPVHEIKHKNVYLTKSHSQLLFHKIWILLYSLCCTHRLKFIDTIETKP